MKFNKQIRAGVYLDQQDRFVLNFTEDGSNDLIDLIGPVRETEFRGNVYRFGYEFNQDVNKKLRTRFIQYIKGIVDEKIPDSDLMKLIYKPMYVLQTMVNRYELECLVYPGSNRSGLVIKLIQAINSMTSRFMKGATFELVKQAPIDIRFNLDAFERVYEDNPNYQQMLKHVEEKLLPAIHSLDYFSIAAAVKTKYRPFIENFLNFSEEDLKRFSRLNASKILVVDDINTSGSTLDDIIRTLLTINPDAEIFIYTLFGKD